MGSCSAPAAIILRRSILLRRKIIKLDSAGRKASNHLAGQK
jgi:hypothetical protein